MVKSLSIMQDPNSRTGVYPILFLMWIGHFLVDLMIGIWPVYKTMIHLDLALTGLIAGLSAFIGEGMQIVFGTLGDKGYRKLLLLLGIGATSFGSLLAYTRDYRILFLVYLMICIGSGAFHPSAVAVVTGLTRYRKGLFVTLFASGGAIGMAFSQLIFSKSYFFLKGNIILMALPALFLVICLIFYRFHHTSSQHKRKYGIQALKQFFKRKDLAFLYLSQVFNQTLYWTMIFLLPDILITRGYHTWIAYGGAHLFFILGGAFMLVPSGYLADRYSPKSVMMGATIVGPFLYYLFLFVPHYPSIILLVLLFCLGATLGIVNPVAVSMGNRIMPSRPGLVSATLMGLVWCVSESLGPGVGGLLTKCFVSDAPAKATAVMGFCYLFSIAAIIKLPTTVTEEEFEYET